METERVHPVPVPLAINDDESLMRVVTDYTTGACYSSMGYIYSTHYFGMISGGNVQTIRKKTLSGYYARLSCLLPCYTPLPVSRTSADVLRFSIKLSDQ